MIYLFLVFLFLTFPLDAQDYYSSDGLGKKGSVVEGPGSAGWVLSLESEGRIKRLFKEGDEFKRWEYSDTPDGHELEEYFYRNTLRTRSILNGKGRIISESLYDSSGDFIITHGYDFTSEGRLTGITKKDEQGGILSHDEILYRPDGSLKGLQGDNGNRLDWRVSQFSRHYMDNHYIKDDEKATTYRFQDMSLVKMDVQNKDKTLQGSDFFYTDNGSLEKEIRYKNGGIYKIFYFDKQGNVLMENTYRDGLLEFSITQEFDNNNLVMRCETSKNSRKKWVYKYENDHLILTQYLMNGEILKEVQTRESGDVTTLYSHGKPFYTRGKEKEE